MELDHGLIGYEGFYIFEGILRPAATSANLQLAAELGKTLLERNQELEENLRQHQIIIEEQANEIEYLTRQASALREVNDSRLKVYEQLEVSITELERTNQKLQQDSTTDKKRIKSLYNSIDTLEKKCEELQELVDGMRSTENQQHYKYRANGSPPELRRVVSLDCGLIESNFVGGESNPLEKELAKLKTTVSKLKCQAEKERQRREELELEISSLLQDNASLQQQIFDLRASEKQKSLQEESMESCDSLCRHCAQQSLPPDEAVPRVIDNEAEAEEPLHVGECTLVQLHNGGLAYGSQTSLQTAGLPVIDENSGSEPTENRNGVSLFSELDDQYKRLIQKYESLLGNHQTDNTEEHHRSGSPSHSKDSIMSNCTDSEESQDSDSRSEMPSPLPLSESAEHSKACSDDFSEAIDSSLSSGFSDMSDHMTIDREVQTDPLPDEDANSPTSNCKVLSSLSSTSASLEGHFNHSPPEYKRLFQEIFAVLKRSLHSDENEKTQYKISLDLDANCDATNQDTSHSSSRNGHFKHVDQPRQWSQVVQQQTKGSSCKGFDWTRLETKVNNITTRIHLPGSMTYAEVLMKGQKRPVRASSQHKVSAK